MKHLISALLLLSLMSVSTGAQDSTHPDANQIASLSQYDNASMDKSSMAVPASTPANASTLSGSVQNGYSTGDYGGRAEIFLSGYSVFGNQVNGNGIGQQETDAGGLAAGYRFHLNSSSSLEGRYGFSRNSQDYTIGGVVSSIPSYLSEISGSYVYTFAKPRMIRPFVEAGGGTVIFIPGSYGTPAGTATSGTGPGTSTGTGMPPGYPYALLRPNGVAGQPYTGSSVGIGTQARGMFLYGGGAELRVSAHFNLRTEFRALGYEAPDFQLNALQAGGIGFTYEPSFSVAYRF